MEEKENKVKFPPAMLDMGMPQEMSPIDEINQTTDDPAMVEVSRNEPWETRDTLAVSEKRLNEIQNQ